MQITLEVPDDLAHHLGPNAEAITRTALESIALEGLRAGTLSKAQARRLLGISSRIEMDGFLKSHGYTMPITYEEAMRDAETALAFSQCER